MIFGQTHWEKTDREAREREQGRTWRCVFAWAPVPLIDGRTALLCWVQRRLEGYSTKLWQYRLPPS